uniref:Uncharacterized protein n=1 Tax=Caenorhabditis japonica TaxID=281687 RepID=A0A8R1I4Q6_CAEJA
MSFLEEDRDNRSTKNAFIFGSDDILLREDEIEKPSVTPKRKRPGSQLDQFFSDFQTSNQRITQAIEKVLAEPGPEKYKNGCSNRRVCMVINDYLSKLSELEAVKAEARIIDLVDKMSNSAISFNGAEIPSPMTSTRNYPSSFDVPFHFDDFDDV